jgi:hypothetical protein
MKKTNDPALFWERENGKTPNLGKMRKQTNDWL